MTLRVQAGTDSSTPAAKGSSSVDFLYAAAILLGGFLLFLVQPLLGKAILPSFGGATGVWATALCFYQGLLLAGYAYAHLCTRLSAKSQAAIHLVLLTASLLWLPILPPDEHLRLNARLFTYMDYAVVARKAR